jgi:5'-nucleotidase/UDP-sugar diphosphatase
MRKVHLAMKNKTADRIDRRTFLATSVVAGAMIAMSEPLVALTKGKKTFTILHTNDLHSNLIGMAPASDYTPLTLNDDNTRGGFARLATKIGERKAAIEGLGPVLVLDAGDFSMGTAFAAATRETGAELRLLAMLGCDATTLGNHDFTLGPDGTAAAIGAAVDAGQVPVVLATNTDFSAPAQALAGLQQLGAQGRIRNYLVIERGGIRFGIFGVLGREAAIYSVNAAPVIFTDPVEAARATVAMLRNTEKVDVVIALSHGGVRGNPDGTFTDGADVQLAAEVPGIDVVVGGHSHTVLTSPIMVNRRTPVVQAGHNGRFLGELTVTIDSNSDTLTVDAFQTHPIDDTILGDAAISQVIEGLKRRVTELVFAPRGFAVDQPLARIEKDLTNASTDLAASTILANLCTDAFRKSTGAQIALTANGLMRNGLTRGITGVQTVYDVFAVAPAGSGVLDLTPGSTLVTGYLTGKELKNVLEFCLAGGAARPGDYFPRASGMRFTYDPTRPQFDLVTEVALGDLDRGYTAIDITGADSQIYGVTSPLFFALMVIAIPKFTDGRLTLVAKNRHGQPLQSRVEAIAVPAWLTPDLLPQTGTSINVAEMVKLSAKGAPVEIKEWQAIMEYLRALPAAVAGELPIVPTDARADEPRFVRV